MKEWLLPSADASKEELLRWRMVIAMSGLMQWGVLGLMSTYLVTGLPGMESYIREAQFNSMQQMVRETREDQLIAQILQHTRTYCLASDAGDGKGMELAFQNLQDARTKYFRLTQREYPQLMCSTSSQPAKTAQ